MTRAQALASAAIITAAADRTGRTHWHDLADALTVYAHTLPAPTEDADQ